MVLLGLVLFGLFALQAFLNMVVGVLTLVGTPFFEKETALKDAGWKLLLLLLACINFAAYSASTLLLYAGISDWHLLR